MSRRRILLIIILSIIFTYITFQIYLGYTHNLIQSSTTLSTLNSQFLDILGHAKYEILYNMINYLNRLLLIAIFLLYIYLFYRHERNRQYYRDLKVLIQETSLIAEGDFDYELTLFHHNFDDLVENINNIVLRLKDAIKEERYIEQTKNELISNVSHDLRTPLTSIVGYLRLIEEDNYRDEVALRHYTGIAFDKSLILEKLMNELFEYTRMQDNKVKLNLRPIDIAEILGQVIVQNEIYFKENKMVCRERMPGVNCVVLGDGERLARVFENLIINAIHYGKEGKYVDVLLEEIGDQIVVKVTNYGHPIPSIDLPFIFDRFYRVEKSRAAHTGGSGLGLAIAKSIINHHDGTIEVESNLEKTSFIVAIKKFDNL